MNYDCRATTGGDHEGLLRQKQGALPVGVRRLGRCPSGAAVCSYIRFFSSTTHVPFPRKRFCKLQLKSRTPSSLSK